MKIERLIGILTVLQKRGKVTAPYLAEKFEVSRRTINRDIEDLCKAGIPVITSQGAGGGISLMEGFVLDSTVFTASELQSILIGLKSLDSVSNNSYTKLLAEKLAMDEDSVILPAESFIIDLSSHYKNSLAPKIELIRQAIHEKRRVVFRYYYEKGEYDKDVEPYLIVFKWSSWYLLGYCTDRNDFRMYKLNRLWDMKISDITFVKRELPESRLDFESFFNDNIEVVAMLEKSEKYKLVETTGPKSFSETEDGRLLYRCDFTTMDSMLSWALRFGDKIEILAPVALKEAIIKNAENLLEKYKKHDI